MESEFLTWWFDNHYILSTILSPTGTLLWCIFKGDMVVRAIVAFCLCLLEWVTILSRK